jgi:hypothetical protein
MSISHSLLVAALLIAASCAPALSNACDSASWKANSGNVAPLVEKMNSDGFTQLADLRRAYAGDVAASPFAIWYLNEFLRGSWQTASNDAVIALLRSVSKHAEMHATVWADPLGTSFSKVDATAVARGLCARTEWPPWDFHVDPDEPAISPASHGLSLLVHMYLAFTPTLGDRVRLASYASDVVRAVRIDSPANQVSVFLIWPIASNDGAAWFHNATYEQWKAIVEQFRDAMVPTADISLAQSTYTEVPAATISAFGTEVVPGQLVDHALTGDQRLSISQGIAYVAVDAAFRAESPKPIRIGPSTFEGHDYYRRSPISQILRPSVSEIPRASGVRSLMYVVVDSETGAILLLGVRE